MGKKNVVRVKKQVVVDRELWRAAKAEAARRGVPLSVLAEEALAREIGWRP